MGNVYLPFRTIMVWQIFSVHNDTTIPVWKLIVHLVVIKICALCVSRAQMKVFRMVVHICPIWTECGGMALRVPYWRLLLLLFQTKLLSLDTKVVLEPYANSENIECFGILIKILSCRYRWDDSPSHVLFPKADMQLQGYCFVAATPLSAYFLTCTLHSWFFIQKSCPNYWELIWIMSSFWKLAIHNTANDLWSRIFLTYFTCMNASIWTKMLKYRKFVVQQAYLLSELKLTLKYNTVI